MTALLKSLRAWAGIVVALAICGCVTVGSDLRRLSGVGRLPRDARIGLVELKQCGEGYLASLDPDGYGQDPKATFLLTCTQLGYPGIFYNGLRQRLEERLGKKLVHVRLDNPFRPKVVLRDAEKLGLDYLLVGDLLAMGETTTEAVILTRLFAIRVADRKVVLKGRIKKTAARGKMQNVIDAVADELYQKAFAD